MIAFDFDRASIQRRLASYRTFVLGGFALMVIPWAWSLSHATAALWSCLEGLFAVLVGMQLTDSARWTGIFWRGLRRQGIAMTVNQHGFIDNASDFTLGQIAWGEIEKMYPWDWKTRLLTNRWPKMPVLNTERGIVIIFKDGVDFETRLRAKPWTTRSAFKDKFRGRRRWIFIPDNLLSVTADELMRQLNSFYITEVRGAA